jgi:citrate lyase beta subunit
MAINPQQLEAYRQALEVWRQAAKEAQKIKDRIYGLPLNSDNMYVMTDQDMQILNKECELYQRLANSARSL